MRTEKIQDSYNNYYLFIYIKKTKRVDRTKTAYL